MQEIFKFVREGVDADGKVLGEMRPMGVRPKFMEVLTARGINLPASLFDPYRKTGPA
jgi:pilus assembly protein CpaF